MYSIQKKAFICLGCGHEEPIKEATLYCDACFKTFKGYSYFDPGECPHCGNRFYNEPDYKTLNRVYDEFEYERSRKEKMKKQTNAIYTYCECCNNLTAIYDWEDKRFICTECGYIDELSPQQERCPECNNLYISFTWFDPCVCPHCGTGLNDPEADYLIPVLEKETEENNES